MLTGGLDPLYRALLGSVYRYYSRVEIWSQGTRIDTFGDAGVPITTGSVSATLTSQSARTFNFTVADNTGLIPADFKDPQYLLTPWGNEARVFAGVDGVGGVPFEWPVFRGIIMQPQYTRSSGQMTVACVDRGGDMSTSLFDLPQNSSTNLNVADQIKLLISDALPDATFGGFDAFPQATPKLTWTSDRASACDDLASAVSAFWYALADGTFTMRDIPWTVSPPPAPILEFSDGQGNVMIDYTVGANRANAFNDVVVYAERADGTTPIYASAQDTDPNSPTYINGPFGRRARQVSSQSTSDQGGAFNLAMEQLRTSTSLTDVWSMTCPPDAAMELGDVYRLTATELGGNVRTSVQVVSGFTLPVTGDGQMTVTFQAQSPGFNASGS